MTDEQVARWGRILSFAAVAIGFVAIGVVLWNGRDPTWGLW